MRTFNLTKIQLRACVFSLRNFGPWWNDGPCLGIPNVPNEEINSPGNLISFGGKKIPLCAGSSIHAGSYISYYVKSIKKDNMAYVVLGIFIGSFAL